MQKSFRRRVFRFSTSDEEISHPEAIYSTKWPMSDVLAPIGNRSGMRSLTGIEAGDMRIKRPRRIGRRKQRRKFQQREPDDRVRDIMFEQTEHVAPGPFGLTS